ncbi:MAG: hypothetical protein JWN82_584 [Candidatus Saccharibacteria bacterium]|nr:hypothetical protein [Candidatus Saccharibacteria bacterium]
MFMSTTHEYTSVTLEPTVDVEPIRSDTIGFYAMPVLANLNNTGDRIQTMVDQLGIPFVMSDLYAQRKRTVFGYTAKTANQVTGDIYRDMSLRRLDFVHEKLAAYNASTVVAMGDSLGVSAVQGMQLHGEFDQRFDALLLRDGWNLKPQIGKVRGLGRYAVYQIKDALFSSGDRTVHEYGYGEQDLEEADETSTIKKLVNVADTMRGPENRQNATTLAGRAAASGEAALNIVCLRQGLSGNQEDMQEFVWDLRKAYLHSSHMLPGHSKFRAEVVDGWHSDLLDPTRGARDVRNTLGLL